MESLRRFLTDQPDVSETKQPGERMSLEIDDSNPQQPRLKLRQQSWAEGMGWFTQKTILLDFAEAAELAGDLAQAIINMKLTRSEAHHSQNQPAKDVKPETKVVEFPQERLARSETKTAEVGENEAAPLLQFKPRR